jgi:hypothetical protein
MKSLALKKITLAEDEAVQLVGHVLERGGHDLTVRTSRGAVRAKRALSCLIEPERDDRVLVSTLGSGECFVLAVLEREAGAAATIVHDGDLEVRVAGRYGVVSSDGVEISTAKDVQIVSASVDIKATEGNLVIDKLSVLGRLAQAELDKVKLFAGSIDTLCERTMQRAKRAYRIIEEIDQVKAGAIDYTARTMTRLHGKNTVITSEELVKVDGNQIHMG